MTPLADFGRLNRRWMDPRGTSVPGEASEARKRLESLILAALNARATSTARRCHDCPQTDRAIASGECEECRIPLCVSHSCDMAGGVVYCQRCRDCIESAKPARYGYMGAAATGDTGPHDADDGAPGSYPPPAPARTEPSRFSVGDRVRVNSQCSISEWIGRIGAVHRVVSQNEIYVACDGESAWRQFRDESLTLVETGLQVAARSTPARTEPSEAEVAEMVAIITEERVAFGRHATIDRERPYDEQETEAVAHAVLAALPPRGPSEAEQAVIRAALGFTDPTAPTRGLAAVREACDALRRERER